ncbi:hypothetical protein Pelo_17090 [Pelomyxa schiedti]|nr:hypothetical protein Pelo_17090 [Pelomyxa schiedti]
MCLECALEHHRAHDLVTIARQAQTVMEQVPHIVEFINKKRALLEEAAQQTECALSTLTEIQRRVEGHINGTINRLMKELQKKKDALLANTSKFFETRRGSLKLQLKCTQSAISQLNDSEHYLKTSAAACQATRGNLLSSLVITTCAPILTNHGNWETSVLGRPQNTLALLSACEGTFQIKQEDATAALTCIKTLSISTVVGDVELALHTMRLIVEGELEQAFFNCLQMFPCVLHGPLCEVCCTPKDDEENHMCPGHTIKTHNLYETFAMVLLYFMLRFKPSLSNSLGPFTKHPAVYLRDVLLPNSSPESHVFLKVVIDAAMSLVPPQPLPSPPAAPKAPPSRIWSLFQASPEQQPASSPPVTPSISTSPSEPQNDWKCGVAALAHVISGYIFHWGVGGVSEDSKMARKENNDATQTASRLTTVPKALAEYFISSLLHSGACLPTSKTELVEHWEASAQLGHVAAQQAVGWCYLTGGTRSGRCKKNVVEAVKWLAMASEAGDAWGQYNMATLYETGCKEAGVRNDVAEAVRLYRLSAAQGLSEAQYELGVILLDGTDTGGGGLQQQREEGVRWLSLAAHQGHKAAIDKLKAKNKL